MAETPVTIVIEDIEVIQLRFTPMEGTEWMGHVEFSSLDVDGQTFRRRAESIQVPAAVEADLQTVVDAMTTEAKIRVGLDDSIPASGNWWEAGGCTGCIAAYRAKGAASYAASKVNLVTPGVYDLTDGVVAPTWNTSSGWSAAGVSSQWLLTTIPATDTVNIFVQYANAATAFASGTMHLAGVEDAVNLYHVGMTDSGGQGLLFAGGLTEEKYTLTVPAAGNLALSGTKGYLNGVDAGVTVTRGEVMPMGGNEPYIWIFGSRTGELSTLVHQYVGDITAVAIYIDTLNAAQSAALAAAMATL